MSRIARVTADYGRSDGGFYIEEPDIPEGVTCREWRRRRAEVKTAERSGRPRTALRWPAPRVAMP